MRLKSTTTVLVTAFDPFAGESQNASELAMRAMHAEFSSDVLLVRELLPTVFGDSRHALRDHIAFHHPAIVVCLGQGGGTAIHIERLAINLDDARTPDNHGAQPIDHPIETEGPIGYWSTLPCKAIVASLREGGWPVALSHTAGTFVCNHVFYGLMSVLERRSCSRGGFVHVPSNALSPDDTARAIEQLIRVTLDVNADIQAPMGALDGSEQNEPER